MDLSKIETLPSEDLTKYLKMIPAVEAAIKKLKQRAKDQINNGGVVDGFKIKETSRKTIKNWHGLSQEIASTYGVNFQQLNDITKVSVSLTDAKRIVKDATGLKGKKLDDLFNEMIEPYISVTKIETLTSS